MASLGLAEPSVSNISINFRTSENDPHILRSICKEPQILRINSNLLIKHTFFLEKGAPFILLKTNLCDRPLKMLIDTGAAVSIIANDIIKENIHKTSYFFSLFGIAGKDVSVTTEGMVHGIFNFDDTFLGSTLHLVDRKYTGTGDGYLGFDFLAPYKVTIDLNNMYLRINLDELIKNESHDEEKIDDILPKKSQNDGNEDNFLTFLAKHYDFEGIKANGSPSRRNKLCKKMKKNEYKKYNDAVKAFQGQIRKYDRFFALPNVALQSINTNNFSTANRYEIIYNQLKLNDCTESEKSFIKDICMEFPLQFYLENDLVGATHVLKHPTASECKNSKFKAI